MLVHDQNTIFAGDIMYEKDKYYQKPYLLPKQGEILAENENIFLKAVSENQKNNMLKVSYECSLFKHQFQDETYRNYLWDEFIDPQAAYYCIYNKKRNTFIGYCGIKNLTKTIPELAIELLPQYRKQGYGFQALSIFMNKFSELTGSKVFRSRVETDNQASQSLHQKLGAVPNGISEFLLHGEDLINYQNENQYLIDDNIRKLAKVFHVEPLSLLGHVLEYKIEWK